MFTCVYLFMGERAARQTVFVVGACDRVLWVVCVCWGVCLLSRVRVRVYVARV